MSTVAELFTQRPVSPRFTVDVDGFTFPLRPRQESRPRTGLPQDRLLEEIVHSIWPTLPFLDGEIRGFKNVADAVQVYSTSWSCLQTCWKEFQGLAETIGRVNLEFYSEGDVNEAARDREIERTVSQSLDKIASAWIQPEMPLSADLVEKPLDEVHAVLRESLWEATYSFASQVLDLLNQMVNQQRIGLIRWAGPSSCEIHFFREIIIQRNNRTVEIVGRTDTQIIHVSNMRRIQRTTTETKEVTTGEHEHRLARQEIHLMDAGAKLLEHTTTLIPSEFRPLVDAIPAWLRSIAEVVDGSRFKHEIVSKPISVDPFSDEQTRIDHRDVIVHPDPAIVLGNRYVLAGWGPEETAVEEDRQASVALEKKERTIRARERAVTKTRQWLAIAILVQVFGLILGAAGAAMYSTLQVLGWFVSLIGVIPFDEAVQAEAAVRQTTARGGYRFYAVGSAVILVLGIQFLAAAYVQSSWPMALACLLLGGLLVPSIRWAWELRSEEAAADAADHPADS